MKYKSGRGGKRAGSGRPKDPNRKIPYSTKLRPSIVKWLKNQDNAAMEIENALSEKNEIEN